MRRMIAYSLEHLLNYVAWDGRYNLPAQRHGFFLCVGVPYKVVVSLWFGVTSGV